MSTQRFSVCRSCLSVGITHGDCVCLYSRDYPIIELEFEVCDCCGHLRNDGSPADTKFNDEQFKKHELLND
jgi:hypothetical protein